MTCSALWDLLQREAAGCPGPGLWVRRVLPEASCNLFLAVEGPERRPAVVLRAARQHLPGDLSLYGVRGIEVRGTVLPGDGDRQISVLLILRDPLYRDVFETLAEDLCTALRGVDEGEQEVAALLERLQKWRRFLEAHGPGGLGEEACRGLYGELRFLRNVAMPVLGPAAVAAWTGCRGAPQDYQFPGWAVEVKTSAAAEPQTLAIAAERQLDPAGLDALYVYHVSVEERQSDGETLVEMIARIRAAISTSPHLAATFEAGLFGAGYLDAHAPRYVHPRYRLRAACFYHVAGDFPRIVEQDLRSGVGGVRYSISVAACRPYLVPESEVARRLKDVGVSETAE